MARSFYGRTGLEFEDNIIDALGKVQSIVRVRVREGVLACGELIRERAHDLANVSSGVVGHAVDGGHMRDHIEVGLLEYEDRIEARIGIDLAIVPYAPHQEFGPHGKPFLRPAVDESRQECHDILRSVVLGGEDARSFVRFRRLA